MVATAAVYGRAHPDVKIEWEARSLQAFADVPIEQLAQAYDLLVIDHPHVGVAARAGCLLALDEVRRDEELRTLAGQSVGPSHVTYGYGGHQWALAIDAATQVASYRTDLLEKPPRQWAEVMELARRGVVVCPLKPVDALMCFFTLSANYGHPCGLPGRQELIAPDAGMEVLHALVDFAQHVPAECFAMNPIEVYELMVGDGKYAYCPLGYGYTNYARKGYRPQQLQFADIASLGSHGPVGSCIGGTGIAVSSRTRHGEIAVDYAYWVASADVQRTIYFDAGGQPGNVVAWEDDRTNSASGDFFRSTRATLVNAYVRPRYDGYLAFQDKAGTLLNDFLRGQVPATRCLSDLQDLYIATRGNLQEETLAPTESP
jgi:multiple sugar transport system substrate-binding protein